MKFSIIPEDGVIVIDGVGASTGDARVSSMVASDVHAIQYDDSRSIGHIEYKRDLYDKTPKGNEMIYELDTAKFKELHSKVIAEMEKEREDLDEQT